MVLARILTALAILITCLVSAPASAATQPTDQEVAAFFDQWLSTALREGEVPGATLVLVRDGRTIFSKGYGVAKLGSGNQLSPTHHLLRQGSISKVVTWLMVMQLVDQGKLDLDRDVNAYLPFRITGLGGRPITTRQLMTHSGGFTERFMGVFGKPTAPLCAQLRDNLPALTATPGDRISYSNSGAGIAACIVEQLTGQRFERAAQRLVFAPLGMRSSTFAQPPTGVFAGRMASQYAASADAPLEFEHIGIAPAGSLSASAEDMGRLLLALMNKGEGESGRLLPAKAMADMLRLHKPLAPGLRSGMGLGFIVREHRGFEIVGHGGTTMAAITDMEIIPALGIGYYIGMTGLGYGGSATEIRAGLPGAVLDRFAPRRIPVRSVGPSTAADLAGIWLPARRYRSGPLKMSDLNLINVSADKDGSLRIDAVRDEHGQPRRWVPHGPDRFVEAATGTQLVAVRDSAGQVVRFASTLVNPVSDLERAEPWLPAIVPLFGGSAAVLLLGSLVAAVLAIARKLRHKAPSKTAMNTRWRKEATICLVVVAATLLGWFALIAVVSDDPYKLASAHAPLLVLGIMAIVTPLLALPIIARGATLLRARLLAAGTGMLLLGLSSVTCGVIFYALGLATTSLAF